MAKLKLSLQAVPCKEKLKKTIIGKRTQETQKTSCDDANVPCIYQPSI